MTIIILDTKIINSIDGGEPIARAVEIAISDGPDEYQWFVGGLPLVGDLQPLLDSNEATYLAAAKIVGRTFDVFGERRLLKAVALVIMDELNILRAQHGLPLRNESQIRTAIKNKLRSL